MSENFITLIEYDETHVNSDKKIILTERMQTRIFFGRFTLILF